MSAKTESRKKDHVEIVLKENVQYSKTTLLEHWEFMHNAIPECDFEKIDSSVKFLGKSVLAPIIIEAMTGGYKDAAQINKQLAAAAEKHKIAFALGSQRAMLESADLKKTYDVRDVAPSIPLVGNVGAFQLKKYPIEKILSLVSLVELDALAVHFNPLQEVLQPEGDKDWFGVFPALSKLCERSPVPIIAKETGAGFSQDVALKLKQAGVAMLDVAGSGGTSWSKVEYFRKGNIAGFEEWGIPTVESIIQCRGVLPLIASGGIRSGIDAAKCIALGATLSGAAYPFLVALNKKSLDKEIALWKQQFKVCCFLTGSSNIEELKKAKLVYR